MTLSDYTTDEEKIAALMCALIDPAIVNITTSGFTTNDIIYIICADKFTLDGYAIWCDEQNGLNSRINSGDVIAGFEAMAYVKDTDITYSDPITLYKSRLAIIAENNELYINNGGILTAGAYGSLIVYGYGITLQTGEALDDYNSKSGKMIPISASTQIATRSYSDCTIKYFDVPSDW